MKNSKTFNFKRIKIAGTAMALLALGSCLKDTGPVQDFTQSPALVSFQYKGVNAVPMVTSLLPGTDDIVNVEVSMNVPSITLGSNVTVTVAADQASLDAYNSDNGTAYTLVPSAAYTIDGSGTVSIAAGKNLTSMVMHVDQTQIDFNTNPAFAFKITGASGAKIATNLNVIIMPAKLRNTYEGNYAVTGYFVHPAAPRPINLTKSMSTVSTTTSESAVGDLGSLFQFDVDASNNLINFVNSSADLPAQFASINGVDNAIGDPNYPGPPYVHTTYNNTYDPANHTFWMHYGYRGAAPALSREIYEEWVLQ
ncbi:MAG: DUF1735 domain-containing protein [Chitinophagales bacterium]